MGVILLALAPGNAGKFLEWPSAKMSSPALLSSYLGVYFEFKQSLNLLWTLDYPQTPREVLCRLPRWSI